MAKSFNIGNKNSAKLYVQELIADKIGRNEGTFLKLVVPLLTLHIPYETPGLPSQGFKN